MTSDSNSGRPDGSQSLARDGAAKDPTARSGPASGGPANSGPAGGAPASGGPANSGPAGGAPASGGPANSGPTGGAPASGGAANGNNAAHGGAAGISAADVDAADVDAADNGTADAKVAADDASSPRGPLSWPNANGSAAPADAPEAAEDPADVPFWDWAPAGESSERNEDGAAQNGSGDTTAADTGSWRSAEPVVTPVEPVREEPQREGIGQHLGNLAHLSANPRMRAWQRRAIIAIIVGVVFGAISDSWRLGLTLAVLAAIADTIYSSRKVFSRKADAKVSAAQRRTRKQLAKLERAGYHAMHSVPIPGSDEQIDHLVVGRAGVFSIDSEAWDKRLPVRTSSHRDMYLGPQSMNHRLEHAQWEAEQAARLLSGELGSPVSVRPAMAVYGPKIPWDIATIRDIDVFSGPRLRRYLRRRARQNKGHLLSASEIERIDRAAHVAFAHQAAG